MRYYVYLEIVVNVGWK